MINWFIASALAQGDPPSGTAAASVSSSGFSAYLADFIGKAITLAAVLAVLMIAYGTFRYATSAGDDSKTKEAKDIIVGAVVGFALLVLIKILVPLLGIEK